MVVIIEFYRCERERERGHLCRLRGCGTDRRYYNYRPTQYGTLQPITIDTLESQFDKQTSPSVITVGLIQLDSTVSPSFKHISGCVYLFQRNTRNRLFGSMFEAGVLNGLTRISIELGSSKGRSDDDFMDRVNHSYTTTVLMLCTLIVLGRQFIGKPMSCWTPNEFTAAQVEYATLLCWATSTYFIPPTEPVFPVDPAVRRKNSVDYYQWVPFVLMFQAAMFSVPCIIWRLFNWQSRIHVS